MAERFKNIKKCLNDFESAVDGRNARMGFFNDDEQHIVNYFEFDLAQALIKDREVDDEKVAKFIFAIKNLSNEIKVKVE